MVETKHLVERLKNLTGADFERAEKEERASGNISTFISTTAGFQMRLAAYALETNINELKQLPLNEYNLIAMQVFNFLFTVSEESTIELAIDGSKTA